MQPVNSVVPYQAQPQEIVQAQGQMQLPSTQVINVTNRLELNSRDSLIYMIFSSICKVLMGAVSVIISVASVLIDHKNPLSDDVIKDCLSTVKDIGKSII